MATGKGTFRKYVDKKFGAETLRIIDTANKIIEEFDAIGFSLTLRQLYYQFVARDMIANKQESYNRLGNIISDARMAGLVSWTAIEDRTRNLKGLRNQTNPADAIRSVRKEYRLDLWEDQPFRPEVWIEKQALEDVVAGICNDLRVDFFACRGYNSQSEQWRAGRRFARRVQKGQRPVVLHLGDHDPSGIDMTRDNQERLSLFAGVPVQVVRLALNFPQIEQFKPPPNPAKMTDSRFQGYAERYGESSWELDALDPRTIAGLISDAVNSFKDHSRYDEALRREVEHQQELDDIIEGLGEDEVGS